VDPRTFDGLIRKLSWRLSRRSIVGGSLGASLLAAVGLGDAALAEKVKPEACVPSGRRCGTKKNDPPCRKCCHGYHTVNAKGRKRCACRPADVGCSNPSQCCTGICENGTCRSAPCRAPSIRCAINSDCCSGICGCVELFPGAASCTCRNATCAPPDGGCSVDADCCTEQCSTTFDDEPTGTCLPP
jgi:hypothetical protein